MRVVRPEGRSRQIEPWSGDPCGSYGPKSNQTIPPSTKKLPALLPHQPHHLLWIACGQPVVTVGRASQPRAQQCVIPNQCTQTTQLRRLSSTTRPAPPAGPTLRCPQHAQALILLLISLRSFFFENSPGDDRLPHPYGAPTMTRESLGRLAFKIGPEALRLWFDFRFGCRDGLREQAFVIGEHPVPRGSV
jgi:hypothetical protein